MNAGKRSTAAVKKRTVARAADAPRSRRSSRPAPSYVVGIGGSAGSLEPLEALFRPIRADTTMAFVVVTHRDPRRSGMMLEILARFTAMPVREAAQGLTFEPGVVYLVPPDKVLDIEDRRMALRDPSGDGHPRAPIDALFRGLASGFGERSVGVVLSGMGNDGTVGLAAIKKSLGIALVQDPASAAYDAMPRSALAAGVADVVGTPTELADRLDALVERTTSSIDSALVGARTAMPAVLAAIRARTGHDFSQYKKSTIERRIERRMNLQRIVDARRYVELIQRDPAEVERLFSDLLIGVTRFFRDPDAFDALKAALPDLLRDRPVDQPLRVWVAGCATGEEAYSLAIAIREHWEEGRYEWPFNVHIYATDLDRAAIDRARKGSYSHDITVDVSPERLARFFVEDAGCYRVKKSIREMVVFATHNIISDPPFTKLDILSCRNVLIYLELDLQRKVLPLFRHALARGGLLLLGRSEGVSGLDEGFTLLEGTHKIFKRTRSTPASAEGFYFPISSPQAVARRKDQRADAQTQGVVRQALLPEVVQRAVVEHVAPPVVVIAKNGDLLFASQPTGRYLEPTTGKTNVNVFAMAREGLELPLRAALRKALARKVKVTERGVRVRTNGHDALIDLAVWPLGDEDFPGAAIAAFIELNHPPEAGRRRGGKTKGRAVERSVVAELRRTKGQLAQVMSEMGESQERLQGVNEELQSANEELQSTNEELTTSKEEMQSMNEELLSVNSELQMANEQLATTNDDMRNLLNSSQIPTLFLDNELRLKRYTVQALRIARLIPADVGRPITDITWSLRHETLASDVNEVLRTLVFKELEVCADDGSFFTMRIHPYRTIDDTIDGVVITFVDITAQKRAAAVVAAADRQALLEQAIGRWPGIAYVEDVGSGRSIVVSTATEKILGYPRSVLAIANEDFWRTLRTSASRRRKPEDAPKDVVKRRSGTEDLCLRRSDGEKIPYRERAVIVARSVDGRATHVLHVFRRRRDVRKGAHGRKAKTPARDED